MISARTREALTEAERKRLGCAGTPLEAHVKGKTGALRLYAVEVG
jgi:hypothetical protein